MALHDYPDLEQGTEEWLAIRRGIVTASVVGQLLTVVKVGAEDYACPACNALPGSDCLSIAKGKGAGAPLKTMHKERHAVATTANVTEIRPIKDDTSRRLTLALVAERITGETESVYMNDDMLRGHLEEPIARDMYSKHFIPINERPVMETGFMIRDDWGFQIGYSPDGLVGDHGLIEVKAPRAKGHIATILSGVVPERHMAQIQAGLLVSGREWCDFISYYGGLPPFVKRVHADPKWAEAIVDAVSAFEQAAEVMTHDYLTRTADMPATERRIELSEITV